MLIKWIDVEYKKKKYVVCFVNHGDGLVPFVIDADDKERVLAIKTWYCHQNKNRCKYIIYPEMIDGKDKRIYLHNFVMNFIPDKENSVDHINRIGLDNRKDNLRMATVTEQNNNMKKTNRKKSLEEMKKHGIDIARVPRFITLVKESEHKGDYFAIQINHKSLYESSSLADLSLRFKFEQTKRIMRSLMESEPELFEGIKLNWNLSEEGLKLRKRYNKILKYTGVKNIKDYYAQIKCPTFVECLEENLDGLTDREIFLLEDTELRNKRQRTTDSHSLLELGITINDLPKYVYYRHTHGYAGSCFLISDHPKLKEKHNKDVWVTSSSKKVSIQEKYQQLLDKLTELGIEHPEPRLKKERPKVRVV